MFSIGDSAIVARGVASWVGKRGIIINVRYSTSLREERVEIALEGSDSTFDAPASWFEILSSNREPDWRV